MRGSSMPQISSGYSRGFASQRRFRIDAPSVDAIGGARCTKVRQATSGLQRGTAAVFSVSQPHSSRVEDAVDRIGPVFPAENRIAGISREQGQIRCSGPASAASWATGLRHLQPRNNCAFKDETLISCCSSCAFVDFGLPAFQAEPSGTKASIPLPGFRSRGRDEVRLCNRPSLHHRAEPANRSCRGTNGRRAGPPQASALLRQPVSLKASARPSRKLQPAADRNAPSHCLQ